MLDQEEKDHPLSRDLELQRFALRIIRGDRCEQRLRTGESRRKIEVHGDWLTPKAGEVLWDKVRSTKEER